MSVNKATAKWDGSFKDGKGQMSVGCGAFDVEYTYKSRLGDDRKHTNAGELIGAAHAGCFTMALSAKLGQAGFAPEHLETIATVTLDAQKLEISAISLETKGLIPGIDEAKFLEIAKDAKENCPISKALKGVADISVKATLQVGAAAKVA